MVIDKIVTAKESHEELGRTLSAAEQKVILGGYVDTGGGGCSTGPCSVYVIDTDTTYEGYCGYVPIPGYPPPTAYCECDTELGYYTLEPGKIPSCTIL